MRNVITDRNEGGEMLSASLERYADRADVVVLGLPRGGVAVARAVADALGAPLSVFVVRKIGLPGQEELAMGAVASGGTLVLNRAVIDGFGIPDGDVDAAVARERAAVERREALYGGARAERGAIEGRTVVVVDDGLATGATMLAAIRALRRLDPARVVVAVPVGSREACRALRAEADEIVCPLQPDEFTSVGSWYEDFRQVEDDEVARLLAGAKPRREPAGA